MQSQSVTMAAPTAANAWTDFAAMTVPAGAQRISKVIFGTSPDEADPAGVRFAPMLRLLGSGMSEQSPHIFLGQAGNIAAKTTSGAYASEMVPVIYDVDIPVSVGGQIVGSGMSVGEAYTAGTFDYALVFDNQPPTQKNSMADMVKAAMTTTADAWSAVDTLTVPTLASGQNPTKIKEVDITFATDQATLALLRMASRIRMSGSGIAEGGLHELLGPHSGTGANTAGILGYHHQMLRIPIDIPVNPGGQIVVEQFLATETPTAGSVIVGVLYA